MKRFIYYPREDCKRSWLQHVCLQGIEKKEYQSSEIQTTGREISGEWRDQLQLQDINFDVLTAVIVQILVFWILARKSFGWKGRGIVGGYERFGGTCCHIFMAGVRLRIRCISCHS
jgi:hypothetical protein